MKHIGSYGFFSTEWIRTISTGMVLILLLSCIPTNKTNDKTSSMKFHAEDILGNPNYTAISYGGYRGINREMQPSIEQLKEDMLILHSLGIGLLRTYNTHFDHAKNLLQAIKELKEEKTNFEMYVMLGAWINCKNAFTSNPIHNEEDEKANREEIDRAVAWAQQYPDIVKIIAVGNEAMVKWAESYYVEPKIILKWVNYLQELKSEQKLPSELWITSSDNFASWGGGDSIYHVPELEELIKAVDFISLHTYPMHDTHYNPQFWGNPESEKDLDKKNRINLAMKRALNYASQQYNDTKAYVHSIDPHKELHIGETGWASHSNGFYGSTGSKATDEYKQALYYDLIREWTDEEGISCFYFEAFDEIWKDANNPDGSENHFGLFTVKGEAKYVLWDEMDKRKVQATTRDNKRITKTFQGNFSELFDQVDLPPINSSINIKDEK